jgi:hypothetical protein
MLAAIITGIDNRKENRAASVLEKPKKSAAVIVIPDLDVPGITAKICDRPIIKPKLTVITFCSSAK